MAAPKVHDKDLMWFLILKSHTKNYTTFIWTKYIYLYTFCALITGQIFLMSKNVNQHDKRCIVWICSGKIWASYGYGFDPNFLLNKIRKTDLNYLGISVVCVEVGYGGLGGA